MSFTVTLNPAFDVTTLLGLAVLLGALGRGLQVYLDWKYHGVGGFAYKYLALVMASNLLLALVARELQAPLAFAICLGAVGLHGWVAGVKIHSLIRNKLRI